MKDRFDKIRHAFADDLKDAKNSKDVEQLQVKYLGRKGPIQALVQELRTLCGESKPLFGKLLNELKEELERLCREANSAFRELELVKKIEGEKIDITLPGRIGSIGRAHPISQIMHQVLNILKEMGFSVQLGPDIDSDYYNFEGLNFPPDHPARDMQDTFYLSPGILLRTHTSNTQLRVMENHRPPLRVVMPGTTYRNETVTARSHLFFHQVEGMYIDREVSFGDLLYTMESFWHQILKREVEMRFRPSYFPFVEPGVEVDISCLSCHGSGCYLCKGSGWLEVCGAGMIHPIVLRNGGIDPEVYTGYAWGMGIERLAILRWGVEDIRDFSENDCRFLAQF
jgi:phenylalanyl-tRNA synthetase alpha chain